MALRRRAPLRSLLVFPAMLLGGPLVLLLILRAKMEPGMSMWQMNDAKVAESEIQATSVPLRDSWNFGLVEERLLHIATHNLNNSPVSQFVKFNLSSLEECQRRILAAQWDSHVSANGLTLIIYHLGMDNQNYSYRVQHDNIQIFFSALNNALPAFTVVQVHGGRKKNLFMHMLRSFQSDSRVCFIDYFQAPYDISAHMSTLARIGHEVLRRFTSVFLLNHSTRGPLSLRENGEWLRAYVNMLGSDVVLAGPTVSCEFAPHIQTHAFAIRTDVLSLVVPHHFALSDRELIKRGKDYIVHAEVGVSVLLRAAGYSVTSRTIFLDTGFARFDPKMCLFILHSPPVNSVILPQLIFYKFGGTGAIRSCSGPIAGYEQFRLNEYLLPEVVTRLTDDLHRKEPRVKLLLADSFCREGPNGNSTNPGALLFRPNK